MDFGIAKAEGLSMTKAGFALGTPYYMAPEQVLGEQVTEPADVYAFGIMLFEMFTGVKPITGETVERLFYQILNEPLNLEPLRQTGVPDGVTQLVGRATAKKKKTALSISRKSAESSSLWFAKYDPRTTAEREAAMRIDSGNKSKLLVFGILVFIAIAVVGLIYIKTRKTETVLLPVLTTDTGEMALVPGGPFQQGKEKKQAMVPPFYIDDEVCNAVVSRILRGDEPPFPRRFPQKTVQSTRSST